MNICPKSRLVMRINPPQIQIFSILRVWMEDFWKRNGLYLMGLNARESLILQIIN